MSSGQALEQVVTAKKAELKAPGLVKRTATGLDPKLLEALFRLPRAAPGQSARTKVELANGDVAVVVSTAVQDAEWSAAPDEERRREAARLRESVAGAEFAAYRADLQKRLDVKIVNPPTAEPEPAS
jgi:peptidyl-prolyl cis-trans isomerase D